MNFSLTDQPIDIRARRQSLTNERAGALVTFEGWVRNHNQGRTVITLAYEAYNQLAEKEGDRILLEAKERFSVLAVQCVHRVGVLQVGEAAVWVGVVAEHRDQAFDACRFIIDAIKTRVPIWKCESYTDGSSGWVNCTQTCNHHPVTAEADSNDMAVSPVRSR